MSVATSEADGTKRCDQPPRYKAACLEGEISAASFSGNWDIRGTGKANPIRSGPLTAGRGADRTYGLIFSRLNAQAKVVKFCLYRLQLRLMKRIDIHALQWGQIDVK